ncbi:MAG: hypothetical protein WCK37_03510 [Candidatus Falkowbacteria bacterium]
MKNYVSLISLVFITMLLAFNSCRKEDFAKPMSKKINVDNKVGAEKTFSINYEFPAGSNLKSMITGVIDSGSTVKLGTTGNIALWTSPSTKCDWTLDGVKINNNVDQILANLTTDHKTYCVVATKTGSTEKVTFYLNVNTDSIVKVITPVITGANTLIRLVSVQSVSGSWLLTWKAAKQISAPNYAYYSNWSGNYQNMNSFDKPTVVSSDSVEFAFYLPNNGSSSTRRTFAVATGSGSWFSANSVNCPFYDQAYFGSGNSTPDNVFTFYFDGTTGTVTNAAKTIVVPGQKTVPIVEQTPGTLGDTTNAVNTAQIINGNLVIYIKLPAGSTVVFQSSATAATAPTAAWTSYIITSSVPGSASWSSATILASDLNKYNWWIYGTGTSNGYKSDPNMIKSLFYLKTAGACYLSTLGR